MPEKRLNCPCGATLYYMDNSGNVTVSANIELGNLGLVSGCPSCGKKTIFSKAQLAEFGINFG